MCPTKGFRPSRPLQLVSVKCRKEQEYALYKLLFCVFCYFNFMCYFNCVSVDLLAFKVGTLINSKIWVGQAENSQAKPSAWETVLASLSHLMNRKTQSALRWEQGWTQPLQCWQCLVTEVHMRELFELIIRKWLLCTTIVMMYAYCSVSRWRPQKVDKRMVLEYTHGLFIT